MSLADVVRQVLVVGAAVAVAGCASSTPQASDTKPAAVQAAVETIVATDSEVDADDPELWADVRDPKRAVLFATDKTDGLYVHDLDGTVRQFLPDGPLNNVDLRTDIMVRGKSLVLVAASDRDAFGIRTYLFDPDTLAVERFGFIPVRFGEPYGFCLGRRGTDVYAIINNKEGMIQQIRINVDAEGGPYGTLVRELKVDTQPEGCVVDDEAQVLYVGEEDNAIWRFDFDPNGETRPSLVARVDGRTLFDDVEGLAIMRDGASRYLIASSQGDSTYPVYRIDGGAYTYMGRFAVVGSATIDGVTETDGLSAWSGPIGPFPEGALAMHDDEDAPRNGQQNFKIVDWRSVKRALNLD